MGGLFKVTVKLISGGRIYVNSVKNGRNSIPERGKEYHVEGS